MTKPDAAVSALLDVKLLRLFDLLYSTRSVTRAAEELGQCQPTVSIWLGKLRRELHDPLFVRTPAGMQPTPQADALIGTAREALEALRRLSSWQPEFVPAMTEKRFRIGMTDASHITLLPQLLAHLRVVAPLARFEAVRIDATTGALLESGDLSLALGLIPELESGFYQQALFEQDWVCLVNRRHPRLPGEAQEAQEAQEALSLRQYQEEAHIGIISGTGHRLLRNALEHHRIERRVVLELPGFLGLAAIVSTTDLIATLPRHIGGMLARINGLNVFPCPVPVPSFMVKQHWHARYHHDASSRWLRGVCASLYQQRDMPGAEILRPAAADHRDGSE